MKQLRYHTTRAKLQQFLWTGWMALSLSARRTGARKAGLALLALSCYSFHVSASRIDTLLAGSQLAFNKGQCDKALHYANQAKEFAESAHQKDTLGWACFRLANAFFCGDNFISAEKNYRNAIEIGDLLGNKVLLSKSYSMYGVLLGFQDKFEDSETSITEALDLARSLNDSVLIRQCFEHLGISKYNQGQLSAALSFQEKALLMSLSLKNQVWAASAYQNIGLIHEENGEYQKAENFTLLALEIREQLGHCGVASECCKTLCYIYLDSGAVERAKESYGRYKQLLLQPEHPGDELAFEFADAYQTKLDSVRLAGEASLKAVNAVAMKRLRWKMWAALLLAIFILACFVFYLFRSKRREGAEPSRHKAEESESHAPSDSFERVQNALEPLFVHDRASVLLAVYGYQYAGLMPKEIAYSIGVGNSTVYTYLNLIRELLHVQDIRTHAIDIGVPLLSEEQREILFFDRSE